MQTLLHILRNRLLHSLCCRLILRCHRYICFQLWFGSGRTDYHGPSCIPASEVIFQDIRLRQAIEPGSIIFCLYHGLPANLINA